jgi:hypothetical protein
MRGGRLGARGDRNEEDTRRRAEQVATEAGDGPIPGPRARTAGLRLPTYGGDWTPVSNFTWSHLPASIKSAPLKSASPISLLEHDETRRIVLRGFLSVLSTPPFLN